jgi:hypothetical protein
MFIPSNLCSCASFVTHRSRVFHPDVVGPFCLGGIGTNAQPDLIMSIEEVIPAPRHHLQCIPLGLSTMPECP